MRTRRIGAGDRVVLLDGSGLEAEGRVVSITADGAEIEILERGRGETESALEAWLLQALPVKLPRMDAVVRQCTELGVARILPFLAQRSSVPGGGEEVLARKRERWERIAVAAAKQSGRVRVPEIEPVTGFAGLPWERVPRPLLLLQPGASPEALRRSDSERPLGVSLVVGPEGGLSSQETTLIGDRGGRAVGLGPRTLRSDTAGAAALSVLQYLWGDLR